MASWRISASTLGVLPALSVTAVMQEPLQFEVASIKRNTAGDIGNPLRSLPNGQITWTNTPARLMILRAYPLKTIPIDVRGLPGWAESERYDVVAKGAPGASAEALQQMWQALLADRMKLAAHYETHERDAYDLVFARADQRPGPGIKPSSLNCAAGTPPPAPPTSGGIDAARQAALKRCDGFWLDADRATSGGARISSLIGLLTQAAGRPIVDRTGLDGFFEITLRYQRRPVPATAVPEPDPAPSVFTAVQEQLGLKLEPSTTQGQVLVIDRIERPTEN